MSFYSANKKDLDRCYNNEDERKSDLADSIVQDLKTGKTEYQESCGLSTMAHLQYLKNGYDFYFDIKNIKLKDLEDYPYMEDWQIEANFYGIDITTDEGWQEYLSHGDHNWLDNIDEFKREFIDSLERPLIFRRLLNIYGVHYSLESWKSMRDDYLSETEYSYNIFLKYSEMLGFIDDEFKEFDL